MATKKEQIDEFLNNLADYVSAEASDAATPPDGYDSFRGMGSWDAKCKMEKSLYKLFDIEIEEEEEEEEENYE